MADLPVTLEPLERRLRAMAACPSAAELLEQLLEGSLSGAPRAALFLVRHGRLRGWRCVGYSPAVAARFSRLNLPADEGWLGRVGADALITVDSRRREETTPDFGQQVSAEALVVPLRFGGSTAGFLVAERRTGELPWQPTLLAILAVAAQVRLELDLARRRQRPSHVVEADDPSATSHPGLRLGTGASKETAETGLVPLGEDAPAAPRATGRREEARRFARLVATDIRLYNEEAVMTGRRHKDLTRRLSEQIQRGRESFLRRFPDLGPSGLDLLEEAFLEVLAAGDRSLLSPQVSGTP